jgi:ribosomal protein S18 acetylase RimI-like enzyme
VRGEWDGETSYRIRPATLSDASFLADVALEALRAQRSLPDDFDEKEWRSGFISWTVEQVRGEISFSATSVIELGDEAVGRLRVVRDGNRIKLAGIQLRARDQRKGIGSSIVESLKNEAATAGLPLELSVEKDNPRARALYERLGFRKVGEDKGEEQCRWTDTP